MAIERLQIVIDPRAEVPFSLMAEYWSMDYDSPNGKWGWYYFAGFKSFNHLCYWFCRDMAERYARIYNIPLLEDKFIPCEDKGEQICS